MITLRQARERAHLTQEAASEALGLSPTVLSRYETGDRIPEPGVFLALCRYYLVDPQSVTIGSKRSKDKAAV